MTKSKIHRSRIDIHELLEQRRQVAVIWGIEDVQEIRPDLTKGQAWEVLQECRDVHDCELGFTWNLLETVADHMFPLPTAGEDRIALDLVSEKEE